MGKPKIRPHRIETPNLIEIKFDTLEMGEIYTQNFYLYIPFFQKLTYMSDPWVDFSVQWLKRCGLAQGCAFWGLNNSELIFDP